MATASAVPQVGDSRIGKRWDRLFFGGMVLLMLATVAVGFAHTYYMAGVFAAPLRSRVLQVHGAVFSLWMILLLVQATLVASGQVRIHRRLGVAGVFIAAGVVVLGVLAAGDSLAHQGPQAPAAILSFAITPFTDMLVFAILAGAAFALRKKPAAHKRLILFATIAMMRAALFRWPFPFLYHNQVRALLASYVFVLMVVAYDLWSERRVRRATMWAVALLVFVHAARIPIGQTEGWRAFAQWFGSLGI